MIGVRPITAADRDGVVDLARVMHGEAPHYRAYPFSEERIEQWLDLFLGQPNWLCLIAEDEDEEELVGMLAVAAAPMIFSEQLTVDDVAFFVRPERRGSTAAVRMIRYVESWAKGLGAKTFRIGLTTGVNPEQGIRFLERFKFVRSGTLMTRDLNIE